MIKILVIDDNADNLLTVKAILRDSIPDAWVYTAENGPDGINITLQEDPDVILLDVVMPDMDGFEVCRQLKEIEKLKDIPVIFLTALKETRDNKIKALEAGGEGFLTKPIDEAELLAQVRAMIKISIANKEKEHEKERLNVLVKERTSALKESEQKWSTILSSIGDAVISTDQSGRIGFMNVKAEELTGWKMEEAYLKPVKEVFRIVSAVSGVWEEDPAERIFSSGIPMTTSDTLLIRKDGKELPIDENGAPIVDGEGKIKGVVIVFRDITERKRAEEELKESEQKYRTIVETASEGIWMGSLEGITTYINEQMGEMLGYSPEEVVGKDWRQFMDEEAIEISRLNIEKRRTGVKGNYEQKYIRKDGTTLWTLVNATPVLNKQGEITHTIGMLADITDRKKAEVALIESERRWATTLSSIGDAVIATDTSGKVTFVNPVAENLTGWESAEVLGMPVSNVFPIIHEETYKVLENPVEKIIQSGTAVMLTNRALLVRKDGSRVPIAHSGSPIRNEDGKISGVVLVFRDITEQRNAENILKNQKEVLEEEVKKRTIDLERAKLHAESADRLKSAFLANMSHELRTPLNSIIGFSGVLLKGFPGPLNEEQLKQIGFIQSSGKHLLSLINDILDLSKIEAGQMQINYETFGLCELLDEILMLQRPSAMAKGLMMNLECRCGNFHLNSDPQRVKQIVINLVNNAIKFTEQGSVDIICERNEERLSITVRDTGIGIATEDLSRLFHPFVQIDNNSVKINEGTGLGLSICKRLVELLKGNISVKSEIGKGSEFKVELPVG